MTPYVAQVIEATHQLDVLGGCAAVAEAEDLARTRNVPILDALRHVRDRVTAAPPTTTTTMKGDSL
ncbi:hypothetical protein Xcel_0548 [Xylanimonas cellulosilytica DSM 15894]|uniref:Uncharacterized protein n=1 Tax=Xylanimonas cellulosilytica (strain DSM 15894 / JCM 12276 / CECT 5975 / KCTC 9989 / LMG 20990 / NBRC 107835 / XIL07) TaxID=446471 RepID=D1BW84_XYLCX|nr:hypothetical protein [Xylanimonas cellulosilytica]ACZ29587.1 hypothetical protein Xcel_0548 [Xylanimonas cellulosilytica DSM 15894]